MLVLVFAVAYAAYVASYSISSPVLGRDFISDEVYYPAAVRNFFYRLGLTFTHSPEPGACGATVFFYSRDYLNESGGQIAELASYYGGRVERVMGRAAALYVLVPCARLGEFASYASWYPGVYRVVPGFRYPDIEAIAFFDNWEHPWLGKWLIALGMLFDDSPTYWRLPGIVEYAVMVALVYLLVYRLTRSLGFAAVASLLLAYDPALSTMAGIAMLEIHAAFFTALLVYSLARWGPLRSGILFGLAAAAKWYSAFALPAVVYAAYRQAREKGGSRREGVKAVALYAVLVPLAFYLLVNAPAIYVLGPVGFFDETLKALEWHGSSKGGHPEASAPWEWLVDAHPFPVYVEPEIRVHTSPLIMLAPLAALFFLPALIRRHGWRAVNASVCVYWSILLFFVLLYLKGGISQFSFFAAILSFPASLALVMLLETAVAEPRSLIESLKSLARGLRWLYECFEVLFGGGG